MKFKILGAGIAAVALLATSFSSAQAADLRQPHFKAPQPYKGAPYPVVAYYNWTGFYLGAVGGYSWGRSNWDLVGINTKPDGWHLGGTLGYNFQAGSFVWGLETDLAWSNLKGSTTVGGATFNTESRWFGTARGRIGYAADRFLPYITGGLAYGDIRASIDPFGLSANKTKVGWTVGAGLEYAFLANWTVKAEYLYVDLGRFDTGFAAPVALNVGLQQHMARVGLNYRFGGPVFSRF